MNIANVSIQKEPVRCSLTSPFSVCCDSSSQSDETNWNASVSVDRRQEEFVDDGLLANDLAGLSTEEQERISKEVEGTVSSTLMEETPELVLNGLESLEEELGKISGPSRSAFDQAMSLNADYVQGKPFRLLFLRADEYDSSKAARRMMKHFQNKLELFGEEKLTKTITYDDLNKEDKAALHCGSFQFLEEPDVKGRTVVFFLPELRLKCSWENHVRHNLFV